MNAAAQTSGLTNPPTGVERLHDLVRWLIALLFIHWLTTRGRKLAADLCKPSGPDDTFLAAHFGTTDRAQILARITCALQRAADLQSELLARSPTEQGFSSEICRVIGARITEIGQELGIYPRAAEHGCASTPTRTPAPRRTVTAGFQPARTALARIQRAPTAARPLRAEATGPPRSRQHRSTHATQRGACLFASARMYRVTALKRNLEPQMNADERRSGLS